MKAAWYERNGPAHEVLQVGELPEPLAGAGEVRVRLVTSAVNPSDVKSRAGTVRKIVFPRQVPHSDGAGIVDQVGPGVDPARLGARVWTWNAAFQRPYGTAAEWVVLPSQQAVDLPDEADFDAGACLGIPVVTAHRAVFCEGPPIGKTVLVSGGAGVVGHYAIQLAKWAGARVLTTVSSPEKAEHAARAGADEVIDYTREDVAHRVLALTAGEGVDHIVEVEFARNLDLDVRVAKMGAVLAPYGSVDPEPRIALFPLLMRNMAVRMVHMYGLPPRVKEDAFRDIARWIRTGRPVFSVAERFRLANIVKAHETVEAGRKIGHVLIDLDDPARPGAFSMTRSAR